MKSQIQAVSIHIRGLVQGVGFRPFVYRMAKANNICGWVENNNEGVLIHAEASAKNLEAFKQNLRKQAPPAANIQAMDEKPAINQAFSDFNIKKSSNLSDAVTEVSPDIAVCSDCLHDMQTQPHRMAYPFINCTNCGPRFTIIRSLPYDRPLTTMAPFQMCEVCRQEYTHILDRRFHAQPVACLHCGPVYQLWPGQEPFTDGFALATLIAKTIDEGGIVALKGLGGFHLICDALNEKAVLRLRYRKSREGKPMAVMMENPETAADYFSIDQAEKKELTSWRRPIVLLKNKVCLAPSVSDGLHTTGLVLPYMPLHYQLFARLRTQAIVLTSGNVSDEPVLIDDETAYNQLNPIADLVIGYNRAIHNRADDSVSFVSDGQARLIRRSRGYTPSPVPIGLPVEGILATGAELNNTFALGKGNQAIMSQHIGDLKNAETLAFYEESFQRFANLFRFTPVLIACDSHPDYLSTQFARSFGIETIEVQHHHAHIASCMAEHGLDEKVIGIAMDGTGYGTDGTIWGAEFFICDLSSFEREYHFDPVSLPGGDQVSKQGWRTALAYLHKYFGDQLPFADLPFLQKVDAEKQAMIQQMLDKKLNTPLSSGAGRLFDAVAALIDICPESRYHAEAPMRLEAAIRRNCRGKYLYEIEGETILFRKLFYQLMKDIRSGTTQAEMAAKFHNTIIAIILDVSRRIHQTSGLKKVVLSGGSFQNRYLLENSSILLKKMGFEVYTQAQLPSNDGGIALGQLAIAAKRHLLRKTPH